ncbi:uncharacterized protein LOC126937279 [Macaca thibetana thibetana]|uniref:uncharacterized protein LOC126937279 n=1 Tax=Macaca thibetana thibetana TaxID=257877 RepID=UPI0021BCDF34|nr:uncharacterized protein LOC126937279 [Macaca thibetana thibetana]
MTVQLLPVLTVIQAFLLFKNFEEENRHVLKILVIRSVWRFRAVNIESGFSGFSAAWVSCLGQSRNPRAVKEEPESRGFWFQDTLESVLCECGSGLRPVCAGVILAPSLQSEESCGSSMEFEFFLKSTPPVNHMYLNPCLRLGCQQEIKAFPLSLGGAEQIVWICCRCMSHYQPVVIHEAMLLKEDSLSTHSVLGHASQALGSRAFWELIAHIPHIPKAIASSQLYHSGKRASASPSSSLSPTITKYKPKEKNQGQ